MMDVLEQFKLFADERNRITNRDSKVLILDGLNRFISVWAAVPALNNNGEHIGGVAAFLKSLGSSIRQFQSTRCIVVFDGSGGSQRRRKIYPEYKNNRRTSLHLNRREFATREEEIFSMKKQMLRIIEYLSILPVSVVIIDQIEADDTISSIVTDYYQQIDSQITIVSSDRDFLQLINDNVSVWNPVKKKLYTPNDLRDEFNMHPNNYLLYRVLTGDSSDNIPGVPGLGLKTLLKEFDLNNELTVEQFLEQCRLKSGKKIFEKILDNEERIVLNYQLMQLQNSDISLYSKNLIRDRIDVINEFDKSKFLQYFAEDQLDASFKYPERWLSETFDSLNYWRCKK